MRRPCKKWSPEEQADILDCDRRGMKTTEIALKYGVSCAVIRGVVYRDSHKDERQKMKERKAKAREMLWTDEQSLMMLKLRERDKMRWTAIGRALRKSSADCRHHYADIMRDLAESERS